jgi:hypothetical protein
MSIFSTILEKLGLRKETPKPPSSMPKPSEPEAKPAAPATAPQHAASVAKAVPSTPRPASSVVKNKPAAPKPGGIKLPTGQAAPATASSTPEEPEEAAPEPMSKVDVMAKLEGMAAKLGQLSNWRTSIADLLFLLGMDHSYKARKELAEELGCPANLMDDSVKMNTWLHKTVLAKIAENGGNIPQELLD